MKNTIVVLSFILSVAVLNVVDVFGQVRTPFHAGIHSGSYTLLREQQLERESKDPRHSCATPYCSRCSKHLADYGHEYQLLDGPRQDQGYYGGTWGRTALAQGIGFDEHSGNYRCQGCPVASISWEYRCALNHAIQEQVNARNAVAAQEACEDAIAGLTNRRDVLSARVQKGEWLKDHACCGDVAASPAAPVAEPVPAVAIPSNDLGPMTLNIDEFLNGPALASPAPQPAVIETDAPPVTVVVDAGCKTCAMKAHWQQEKAALAATESGLAAANRDLKRLTVIADEKVRIALLSKDDADKATRFKRVFHKPPRYQEVLAAREAEENAKKKAEKSPTLEKN